MNLFKKTISTYFFYTPSAVQAKNYCTKTDRPSTNYKLTRPLRLLYYAIILQFALRLTLYSLYQESYTQYDQTMALLDSATTHHMIGLTLVPFGVEGFFLDYLLRVVTPSPRIASLMMDTLVYNRGTVNYF